MTGIDIVNQAAAKTNATSERIKAAKAALRAAEADHADAVRELHEAQSKGQGMLNQERAAEIATVTDGMIAKATARGDLTTPVSINYLEQTGRAASPNRIA